MTPWRVVIADDEPLARRGVRQLLARHKAFEVVRECRDGFEARAALATGEVDLVFLDIAMPGADGIAVAQGRVAVGAVIVFLTAHSTRAVEAFEADAADYLVKPVSEARFARTMARVTDRLQARRSGVPSPTLLAHTSRGTVILPANEVEWIEGANHYARVWHEGKGYLVREPLDALEQRLAGAGFVRVHRGALVRRAAIVRIGRDAEGRPEVILRSRAVVPVARRRVAEVLRLLQGLGLAPSPRPTRAG
jgi:two-component system LytT family response regulator